MKYLLDTHIILWAIADDSKLSQLARGIIENTNNDIYYSVASIWEITIKHLLHTDRMPFSGKMICEYCIKSGYRSLSIKNNHVFELDALKYSDNAPRHNDPFDRILIAQAKSEKMVFITHDSLLPNYNESCVLYV